MSSKIEFFFTHGHSFTATNVVNDSLAVTDTHLHYSVISDKENGDIKISSNVEVALKDLKFAVVTASNPDSEFDGVTTIIHGIAKKFDVLATFEEAEKIRKIEAQERQTQETIEYKRQREAEKFVERRKKRSAERKEQHTKTPKSAK